MLSCRGSTSPRPSTVACKVFRSWFDYIGSQLVSIRSISFRFDSIVRFDFDAVLWSCFKQLHPSPVAVVVDELLLRIPLVDGLWVGNPDVVRAIAPFRMLRLLNSITFDFNSNQFDRVRFDSIQSISVRFHSISEGCCPVVARDLQSGYWWRLLFELIHLLYCSQKSPEFDLLSILVLQKQFQF